MENPCKECLVAPTCSQICWEKQNYTTLLKDAIRKQSSYIVPNLKRNRFHKVYLQKSMINTTDLCKIQSRRS
jgi:hypothetical protein